MYTESDLPGYVEAHLQHNDIHFKIQPEHSVIYHTYTHHFVTFVFLET
jgi:hypothetical protein